MPAQFGPASFSEMADGAPANAAPAPKSAEIAALCSEGAYEGASAAPLAAHIASMASGNAPYDFDVCLTYVRLLRFEGGADPEGVCRALALALGRRPGPDFDMLLSLLSREALAEEGVAGLVALADAVVAGAFQQVWSGAHQAALGVWPGLADALRALAVHSMRATLQNTTLATLAAMTGLEGAALTKAAAQWPLAIAGDVVTFNAHPEAQPRQVQPPRATEAEELTRMVQLLVPAGCR